MHQTDAWYSIPKGFILPEKKPNNSKRITVNITEELESKLASHCNKEEVKMAWVLRKALTEYLDKNLDQQELPIKL